MGPRPCRRLLKAVAKVSRGRAEFLSPAERLQPKVRPRQGHGGHWGHRLPCLTLSPSPPQLIKSLKKAIEPAVSDITIDWYVPDSMEALLSPTELPALYPGDRLVSYCVLYSIARFGDRRPLVRWQWPGRSWHGPSAAQADGAVLSLSGSGRGSPELPGLGLSLPAGRVQSWGELPAPPEQPRNRGCLAGAFCWKHRGVGEE